MDKSFENIANEMFKLIMQFELNEADEQWRTVLVSMLGSLCLMHSTATNTDVRLDWSVARK